MLLLVLAVVAAVTANPGVAFPGYTTSRHHPPLLDCTPAPAPSTHKHNDTSFRANLAAALAGLPSAAAAAPQRSAIAQSVESGPDRAFALGLCFGAPGPSSAGDCLACLTAAAKDLTGGCGGAIRRAGVWRAGCFMAYADNGGSSAREDAFRGWFNAGSNTTLALADGGECMVDGAADCMRCIDDSLLGAPPLGWLWRLRGGEVVAVSYTCFLSIKISSENQTMAKFWAWYTVAAEALIIGVLFCLIILTLIRGLP